MVDTYCIHKLQTYKKKTITLVDLGQILGKSTITDLESLYKDIQELVFRDMLAPVKASKTNGHIRYPLYNQYHIHIAKRQNATTEIGHLHPLLLKNGYLARNPEKYASDKQVYDGLSKYLFRTNGTETPVSRKERSYEIYKEIQIQDQEKVLDNFEKCVKAVGLTKERLCFYDTPEYYHDYIPRKKSNMTLLVCENKDIWFDIRRSMYEGKMVYYGCEFDGVVYGEGNAVTKKGQNSSIGGFSEYCKYIGCDYLKIYYWGDIDRYGLYIYQLFVEANPLLDIELFTAGYSAMCQKAMDQTICFEDCNDGAIGSDRVETLMSLLNGCGIAAEHYILIDTILTKNKRIPQEIITMNDINEA